MLNIIQGKKRILTFKSSGFRVGFLVLILS